MEPLLNTLPTAIHRLGIGRSKFYELVSTGELHVVRIGRRVLIAEAELLRYVAKLSEGA